MHVSNPSPRRRGPRRRLDLDRVVKAALARLDAEGVGALSVRSTAAALGVHPNALYTYVEDRAALERAIVEDLLGRADVSQMDGSAAQWRERIVRFATALRLALLHHPAAASLFLTAPMNGPNALAVGEGILVALEDGGLAAEAAARGAYVLIVFVLGSVALEVAETDGRPPLRPEGLRIEERLTALGGVDSAAFPRTADTATIAAGWISSAQFAWGLDRVLDGIASTSPSGRG